MRILSNVGIKAEALGNLISMYKSNTTSSYNQKNLVGRIEKAMAETVMALHQMEIETTPIDLDNVVRYGETLKDKDFEDEVWSTETLSTVPTIVLTGLDTDPNGYEGKAPNYFHAIGFVEGMEFNLYLTGAQWKLLLITGDHHEIYEDIGEVLASRGMSLIQQKKLVVDCLTTAYELQRQMPTEVLVAG